jgi:hypothetical protein
MKRLLVLAALVTAIAVVNVQPAAPAGDTRGPACANITDGSILYPSSTGVITADVLLGAPTCSYVTYRFTVYDTTTGSVIASPSTYTACTPEAPGGGCIEFTVDLGTSGPATVCVSGDTLIHGHVADHAPDFADPACPTPAAAMYIERGVSGAQGFH